MSTKDVLSNQFAYCSHVNGGWFVTFENAIKGLSSEDAYKKPGESANSIHEIVVHLNFWNKRYLERFLGQPNNDRVEDNNVTFKNEETWNDSAANFQRIMEKWIAALTECEEAKLDLPNEEDRSEPWRVKLTNLVLHNAHHIGQIVTTRKIMGNWDPKYGVS
ncbi:DinB family protein [Neobacillus terrae]|uniref:DinB family protein n=1 Tax=Neobacillus terrae TaxID=3034837 RepID=UPI00140AFA1A|nr:DinB family protein [Neobacillus terrae]NHM32322.1 DinB family protein [Neobacillus terrae]